MYTNIKVQQKEITPAKAAKYPGVTLDEKLTYREHIQTSIQKGYIALRYLYPLMISKNLTMQTKVVMYKMLIRPILIYAAPAWRGAAFTNLRKLQVFENKCLRLTTNSDRYIRLVDLYERAR